MKTCLKMISALNESESLKTIREVRKEKRDEYKIFRNLNFLFEPEKNMNLKKVLVLLIIAIFNMKVWEIKTKKVSVEEYIHVIRPYLSNIINNHKAQGKWRIY